MNHLTSDAVVDEAGVHLGGMNYKTIVLDGLKNLPENVIPVLHQLEREGRLIIYKDSPFASIFPKAILANNAIELLATFEKLIKPDLMLTPSSENIRYRHVIKDGVHYYILFNEAETAVRTEVQIPGKGEKYWLDESNGEALKFQQDKPVDFEPHEMKILMTKTLPH
jgi:hypothetical protein